MDFWSWLEQHVGLIILPVVSVDRVVCHILIETQLEVLVEVIVGTVLAEELADLRDEPGTRELVPVRLVSMDGGKAEVEVGPLRGGVAVRADSRSGPSARWCRCPS